MTTHNGIRVRLAGGPRVISDGPVEVFRLKPQPWTEDALCREVGIELFVVDAGEKVLAQLAKKICNGDETHAPCPVKAACLSWALEVDDRFAVLGGMTPRARRKLVTERRREAS